MSFGESERMENCSNGRKRKLRANNAKKNEGKKNSKIARRQTLITHFVFVDSHVIGLLRTWFLMKFCIASSILPPVLPFPTSIFCSAVEMLAESISDLLWRIVRHQTHKNQISDCTPD